MPIPLILPSAMAELHHRVSGPSYHTQVQEGNDYRLPATGKIPLQIHEGMDDTTQCLQKQELRENRTQQPLPLEIPIPEDTTGRAHLAHHGLRSLGRSIHLLPLEQHIRRPRHNARFKQTRSEHSRMDTSREQDLLLTVTIKLEELREETKTTSDT